MAYHWPQPKRYWLEIEAAGGLRYAANSSRSTSLGAVRPAQNGPSMTHERAGQGRNIGMATTSGAAAGGGLSTTNLQIGWQYRAACKGPVSNLFFAPNHLERKEERLAREAAAKAICRTCPVLAECREYALLVREPHGIWGGLNEYERRQLLARRAG
jgi:WhiB family transcriptional regulator, redox-sensing transcriptional regulator